MQQLSIAQLLACLPEVVVTIKVMVLFLLTFNFATHHRIDGFTIFIDALFHEAEFLFDFVVLETSRVLRM